jgi:hypothetical protein
LSISRGKWRAPHIFLFTILKYICIFELEKTQCIISTRNKKEQQWACLQAHYYFSNVMELGKVNGLSLWSQPSYFPGEAYRSTK